MTPGQIRARPLAAFVRDAEAITDSPFVLGTYAAPEWAELSFDGQQWVCGLLREMQARVAEGPTPDDLDTPEARLDMVRGILQLIVDGHPAVPMAKAGIDFCDLTEAERQAMRGDGPPVATIIPESTNAQHAAMFARIRANAEKLTIQSGDLTDLLATVALAERAVMGEGEHAGAGWLRSMFARNGVLLPLAVDKDGAICDRLGGQVLVIDVNRERGDDKAAEIAGLVVLAVNTCGGHAPRTAS